MFKKATLAVAAAATALVALPAAAQPRGNAYGYYNNSAHARGYDRYQDRRYDNRYQDRRYDNRYQDRRGYETYGNRYDDRYADRDYRDDNRRCSGTTGTIVGGVAGALAGRAIDRSGGSRYSRRDSGTTGAIIGGALGALGGRAVDKSSCNNDRRYR
ncbi:MAG TPA: glycine zipper 2TM domain-containing protein [Allosphingosinicella sp.]|nr:glycine zipper 2TM domain-containing protein [Allosphingosinicella sp.]